MDGGRGKILTIVQFWGGFGLLSTRDRPAGDPRKTPEKVAAGEILKIELFWQRRGVYQCTSVPVVSINSPARVHVIVLENDWYTGTLVQSFPKKGSRIIAPRFLGNVSCRTKPMCLVSGGIKNLARAMPSQRKEGFIRRIVEGVCKCVGANPYVRLYPRWSLLWGF